MSLLLESDFPEHLSVRGVTYTALGPFEGSASYRFRVYASPSGLVRLCARLYGQCRLEWSARSRLNGSELGVMGRCMPTPEEALQTAKCAALFDAWKVGGLLRYQALCSPGQVPA